MRVYGWCNFRRVIYVYLVASTQLSFGNVFFLVLICEWSSFMRNVAFNLVLSIWASVAFPPCGDTTTPSGKGTFDFCDISHTLFRVLLSPHGRLFLFFLLQLLTMLLLKSIWCCRRTSHSLVGILLCFGCCLRQYWGVIIICGNRSCLCLYCQQHDFYALSDGDILTVLRISIHLLS